MTRLFLACMALLLSATLSLSHEVPPTIGDLTVGDDGVTLRLELNVEAFVAGIDLDGLEDTNVSPQADTYDMLRALPSSALQAEFAPVAATMAQAIGLNVDGAPAAFRVQDMAIGPVGDIEGLRESVLTLFAPNVSGASLDVTWPDGFGTLILRQIGIENGYTGYLDGGQSTGAIAVSGGDPIKAGATILNYIPVGFDHILPKGLDHILFVLGLFFLSLRLGALLWQVTAFTLAHSVTLALGALGIVTVPGSIVEPIIAASIVYVAVENILSPKLTPWRPLVVFAFGLLHGLGFASVLGEFGLPSGQFLPALIGFNIGVELGQITVIAMAYALVGHWFGEKPWYRARIAIPASVIIALIGVYWMIERTLL